MLSKQYPLTSLQQPPNKIQQVGLTAMAGFFRRHNGADLIQGGHHLKTNPLSKTYKFPHVFEKFPLPLAEEGGGV